MCRSSNPIPLRSWITNRNMIGGPQTKAVVFSTLISMSGFRGNLHHRLQAQFSAPVPLHILNVRVTEYIQVIFPARLPVGAGDLFLQGQFPGFLPEAKLENGPRGLSGAEPGYLPALPELRVDPVQFLIHDLGRNADRDLLPAGFNIFYLDFHAPVSASDR